MSKDTKSTLIRCIQVFYNIYSVSSLQSVIARGFRIPEDKQVLLVSGGESLDPGATVGKYHAGTVSDLNVLR